MSNGLEQAIALVDQYFDLKTTRDFRVALHAIHCLHPLKNPLHIAQQFLRSRGFEYDDSDSYWNKNRNPSSEADKKVIEIFLQDEEVAKDTAFFRCFGESCFVFAWLWLVTKKKRRQGKKNLS